MSLRQKEHICCLRPYGHAIAMHTMHYPDEIRGVNELNLPEEQTAIAPHEMAMATTLIDQLVGRYDPSQYQDGYRLALEQLIEGKLGAEQPVIAAPTPATGKVTDLMEALRASIAAAKKQPSKEATPPTEDEVSPTKKRSRAQGTRAAKVS